MSFHSHAMRKGATPIRIEDALANGPLTLVEIAEQLHLALGTIRNQIAFTDAIPVGHVHNKSGRPRVRYALRGTPLAQEAVFESCEHITVLRVQKALLLQHMTIPELCRALSLWESSIRVALPRTGAMAIEHRMGRRKHGRRPVVYGFLSKAA